MKFATLIAAAAIAAAATSAQAQTTVGLVFKVEYSPNIVVCNSKDIIQEATNRWHLALTVPRERAKAALDKWNEIAVHHCTFVAKEVNFIVVRDEYPKGKDIVSGTPLICVEFYDTDHIGKDEGHCMWTAPDDAVAATWGMIMQGDPAFCAQNPVQCGVDLSKVKVDAALETAMALRAYHRYCGYDIPENVIRKADIIAEHYSNAEQSAAKQKWLAVIDKNGGKEKVCPVLKLFYANQIEQLDNKEGLPK